MEWYNRSTKIGIFLTLAIILSGSALFFAQTQSEKITTPSPLPSPTPIANTQPETVDINASFTIRTDSITRSFTATKYHNQSPDVFITADDPTKVHVKKAGITWDDFFKTLPMKLTKDCLTTGDGETFCDGADGSLKFFLNDLEDKDLLDKEIKDDDKTLIKFISS